MGDRVQDVRAIAVRVSNELRYFQMIDLAMRAAIVGAAIATALVAFS